MVDLSVDSMALWLKLKSEPRPRHRISDVVLSDAGCRIPYGIKRKPKTTTSPQLVESGEWWVLTLVWSVRVPVGWLRLDQEREMPNASFIILELGYRRP